MLVADDADQPAILEDRRVEHRDDAERLEVGAAQLVGEGIRTRVAGGHVRAFL